MSVKANPSRIGMFIVGAIVILVASIVVFGSGELFQQRDRYVAFFDGTVAGLSVGAPVTFRGVPIGSVTSVRLKFSVAEQEALIPVYFDIFPDKVDIVGPVTGTREERTALLIEAGMRATLTSQSLVTGQLAIEISFQPGTPVNLVAGDFDAIQIPTVPSTIEELVGKLQRLDLDRLVDSANKLINDVDVLVSTPDARALVPDLRTLINTTNTLVTDLNVELKPTLASLRDASDSAKSTFDQGTTTIANVDRELGPVLADVRQLVREVQTNLPGTMRKLDSALASAQSALDAVDETAQPDSATIKDLRRALVEFAGASRSVRKLADELERKPSMLIRGK